MNDFNSAAPVGANVPPSGSSFVNGALVGNFASYTPGQDAAAAQTATHYNPLRGYSLRGQAVQLKSRVTPENALLGRIANRGQFTVVFGPGGSGKSLIALKLLCDAVSDGHDPDQIYYAAISDSAVGLHDRAAIVDTFGFHLLAAGEKNFNPMRLAFALGQMIRTGTAKGCVVVIDGLSEFEEKLPATWRLGFHTYIHEFTRAGGTLIGIESTAKTGNSDGLVVCADEFNIHKDAHSAWLLTSMLSAACDVNLLTFVNVRSRDLPQDEVSYRYAVGKDISYQQLFESVRYVSDDELSTFEPWHAQYQAVF